MVIIGPHGVYDKHFYFGKDAHTVFINKILEYANSIIPLYNSNRFNITFTENEYNEFTLAEKCGLCQDYFIEDNYKVMHHLHWSNELYEKATSYICAAHRNCNLKVKLLNEISVFFHCLSNFDCHLIIQGIKSKDRININCLAKSTEKFLCLKINKIVNIMDSYVHLPASLDSLVKDLRSDGLDKFKITKEIFKNNEDELQLIIQKQPFPYECITMDNLVLKRKNLPPIEAFDSILKNRKCTDSEYAHACKIFKCLKIFKCESLLDFLRHYNILDCTLTADVLRHQRDTAYAQFGMELFRFVSAPLFCFQAGLSQAEVNLECVKNVDIHYMVRRSIRGSIVNIPTRYAKANIVESHLWNPAKPRTEIIFLDFTGLHRTSQFLYVSTASSWEL